ncbi:hypothetical protein [Nocardia sp. NPDC004860]|uniref:hypothetical protein n=1 Tax=Nocardia sp. NPDC004860 TaxID=3154557 RepID=UPI0033B110FC
MRTVTRILLMLATLVSALALLPSQAMAIPADPALDEATSQQLDELLAVRNSTTGTRTDAIAQLSSHFLGTPTARTCSSAPPPSPSSWSSTSAASTASPTSTTWRP